MRRGERVYHYARYRVAVIGLLCLFLSVTLSCAAHAAVPIDRYDTSTPQSSSASSTSSTSSASSTSPYLAGKEDIDRDKFNGDVLDTIIYIIGGLAGFAVILHIFVFGVTRVYPSTNRFFEHFKVIGIDGYDKGFVIPLAKILLLGVFSFLCISGMIKQAVGFILGLFAVLTGG